MSFRRKAVHKLCRVQAVDSRGWPEMIERQLSAADQLAKP
jgi:hypothetical protein